MEGGKPDVIVLHEKAWLKKLRNIYGRNWYALRESNINTMDKRFYPELSGIPLKII